MSKPKKKDAKVQRAKAQRDAALQTLFRYIDRWWVSRDRREKGRTIRILRVRNGRVEIESFKNAVARARLSWTSVDIGAFVQRFAPTAFDSLVEPRNPEDLHPIL